MRMYFVLMDCIHRLGWQNNPFYKNIAHHSNEIIIVLDIDRRRNHVGNIRYQFRFIDVRYANN